MRALLAHLPVGMCGIDFLYFGLVSVQFLEELLIHCGMSFVKRNVVWFGYYSYLLLM